jgi:hypothetical protein
VQGVPSDMTCTGYMFGMMKDGTKWWHRMHFEGTPIDAWNRVKVHVEASEATKGDLESCANADV